MAFKAIDKREILGIVSINDPAIDVALSDVEAYQETHDRKHLVFRDDEVPTIFKIGVMSYMTFSAIKDKHITIELNDDGQGIRTNVFGLTTDALRHSLKSAENLPFDLKIEKGKLSNSTMDKLAQIGVVDELGGIALEVNGFGDDDEKK